MSKLEMMSLMLMVVMKLLKAGVLDQRWWEMLVAANEHFVTNKSCARKNKVTAFNTQQVNKQTSEGR
jgi:hypothetical protein